MRRVNFGNEKRFRLRFAPADGGGSVMGPGDAWTSYWVPSVANCRVIFALQLHLLLMLGQGS